MPDTDIRHLLEQIPTTIAVFDRQMCLRFASRQWHERFGSKEQTIRTRRWNSLFADDPLKGTQWRSQQFQRCLEGAAEGGSAEAFRRVDGTIVYLDWEATPLYNETGEIDGVIFSGTVVQSEAATPKTESDRMLHEIAKTMPGSIFQFVNRDGVWIADYMSDFIYNLTGLTAAEIVHRDLSRFFDRVHPEEFDRFVASVNEAVENETPWHYEGRIVKPDGEVRWWQGEATPTRNENGEIVVCGVMLDITERKQTERRLQQSLQELADVKFALDRSAIVAVTDDRGTITHVNDTFCQLSGYTREELLGQNHRLINSGYHPIEFFQQMWSEISQGRVWHGEIQNRTKHGVLYWVDTTIVPYLDAEGKPYQFISIRYEITARKRAETELARLTAELEAEVMQRTAALQKNEQFLRSIYEGTNNPIFVVDVLDNDCFRYFTWNAAAENFSGISRTEIFGKTCTEVFGIKAGELGEKKLLECVQKRDIVMYEECLLLKGEETWWLTTFNPLEDSNGRIYRVVGTTFDMTERKQAEEQLQRITRNLQEAQRIARIGNWEYDILNEKITWSEEVFSIFDRDPTLGEPDLETAIAYYHPHDRDVLISALEQAMKTGDPYELELRAIRADETLKHVHIRMAIEFDDTGVVTRVYGTIMDINDRKQAQIAREQKAKELEKTLNELQRTQAQMIQSEKMSSLGQMVAGVAHEINNPVNFIHGNLTHAQDYLKDLLNLIDLYQQHDPNPHAEIAEEIEAIELDFIKGDLTKLFKSMRVGTERIREIVLSLRNFSRLDESDFKEADIHEGLNNTLMILHNRIKAKTVRVGGTEYPRPEIEIVRDYSDEFPLVECYPGQLNQVFMNLLSNAIDALEEAIVSGQTSAQIRIQTELIRNVTCDDLFDENAFDGERSGNIALSTPQFQDWVAIKICDNGPGIPSEILSKLFDPFFTTKPVGQGTGLGLSISYQIIVDRHGGRLYCCSELGKGSHFSIQIPLRQGES